MHSLQLLLNAQDAGERAANECTPTPMIVMSGERRYQVDGGVCGFAWIHFKLNNKETRKFINELKKKGIAGDVNSFRDISKSITGGYTWWCPLPTQSMAIKEAYMKAACEVLRKEGINCRAESRID